MSDMTGPEASGPNNKPDPRDVENPEGGEKAAAGVEIGIMPEGRLVGTAKGPDGRGHHLAVSADGYLAIGSQDGTIQIVNFQDASQRRTIEAHEGGIQALRYDRFDRLYSSGADRLVKAWHPMAGRSSPRQRRRRAKTSWP